MTDWKKYFNSTILSRGRQYYHEGRVKRLTHRDHEWFAAVKGSRSYNVIAQMGEDGDIEDMECSCLYAYNGQNCKHMAALLYAVEADQKENDVQTESELAQQRMDKEDKVIFKKLAAQTEYNYFDLNMAAQKLELSRGIWEKAKRLAEQKQILRKLQRYTVSISPTMKEKLRNALYQVGDTGVLVLNDMYYNQETGVQENPTQGFLDF